MIIENDYHRGGPFVPFPKRLLPYSTGTGECPFSYPPTVQWKGNKDPQPFIPKNCVIPKDGVWPPLPKKLPKAGPKVEPKEPNPALGACVPKSVVAAKVDKHKFGSLKRKIVTDKISMLEYVPGDHRPPPNSGPPPWKKSDSKEQDSKDDGPQAKSSSPTKQLDTKDEVPQEGFWSTFGKMFGPKKDDGPQAMSSSSKQQDTKDSGPAASSSSKHQDNKDSGPPTSSSSKHQDTKDSGKPASSAPKQQDTKDSGPPASSSSKQQDTKNSGPKPKAGPKRANKKKSKEARKKSKKANKKKKALERLKKQEEGGATFFFVSKTCFCRGGPSEPTRDSPVQRVVHTWGSLGQP